MNRSIKLCLCAIALATFASSSGCTAFTGLRDCIAYNDSANDFVISYRNDVWAADSWHQHKHAFAGEYHLKAFGDGYRAGYVAVASGGSGCPPAIPPRKYWRWQYQTPEGQAQMAAWSSGFPHGAAAAEQDLAGEFMEIPVSENVKLQYSPEFESGTMYLPNEVLEEYQIDTPPNRGAPRVGWRDVSAPLERQMELASRSPEPTGLAYPPATTPGAFRREGVAAESRPYGDVRNEQRPFASPPEVANRRLPGTGAQIEATRAVIPAGFEQPQTPVNQGNGLLPTQQRPW